MRNAETILAVIASMNGLRESRMTRKCHVRFGGGRMEKDATGSPRAEEHRDKPNLASRLPYEEDAEVAARKIQIRIVHPDTNVGDRKSVV